MKKVLALGFNKAYYKQRYSGIVQSVEQRTVKLGATWKESSSKTAEICGFLTLVRCIPASIFGKKCAFYMLFIAPFL